MPEHIHDLTVGVSFFGFDNINNFVNDIKNYHRNAVQSGRPITGANIDALDNLITLWEERAEILRNLSLEQTYIKEKYQVQFVVKNLKINYMYYCKLDDQINLVTDLESVNRAKLCFRHIFYKEKKEISKIQVTVCCISNAGRVARIPKSLYHKFIN